MLKVSVSKTSFYKSSSYSSAQGLRVWKIFMFNLFIYPPTLSPKRFKWTLSFINDLVLYALLEALPPSSTHLTFLGTLTFSDGISDPLLIVELTLYVPQTQSTDIYMRC